MSGSAKTTGMRWRWIAWFILMPIPFPFFNLITYFYLLILTPAMLIPAYYSDPYFSVSRYMQWDAWFLSLAAAIFNFILLQYVIAWHDKARAEGKKTGSVITCGAAGLMFFGYAALYAMMKSAGG